MDSKATDEFRKVTVRNNGGKAHRALKYQSGSLTIVCGCPNTQNGRLANRSRIIAEGWEAANCGRSSLKAASESDLSEDERDCLVGMSRGDRGARRPQRAGGKARVLARPGTGCEGRTQGRSEHGAGEALVFDGPRVRVSRRTQGRAREPWEDGMSPRYDRRAIGKRASELYRQSKLTSEPMTWGEAQRRAWAEAKSPRAIERCGTKVVARIDGAQPGGVIAMARRYGISIAPVVNFAVSFGEHLTEVLHTAAVRRQRRVDALRDGGRVVEMQNVNGEWM